MSSPPPPPIVTSTNEPQAFESTRFKSTGLPCESPEEYRPGGFHPVELGDTFKDYRYRVIRKLGNGSYSTVWLAVDNHTARFVALKIMIAKESSDIELAIYERLKRSAQANPWSQHLNILLDSFEHVGPNGTHRCLLFEAMGPSTVSMVNELPANKPKVLGRTSRYPKAMSKIILKDALTGLAFLHENGVIHGDFQPGNLLFGIRDLQSVNEDVLRQDKENTTQVLHRLDGKSDPWAPQYLTRGQSLHEYVDLGPGMIIKVSDLGAASWADHPPRTTMTPLALRAPELIFKENFNSSIDIWSYGCLVYEFLTGTSLFTVCAIGDDEDDGVEEADDDHLLDLNDIIQPLPESWLEKWPRADRFFGPTGERSSLQNAGHTDDGDEGEEVDAPFINDTLELKFDNEKPDDIDVEEAKEITTLIRQILQFEPSKRPSAIDLLNHTWFKKWLED